MKVSGPACVSFSGGRTSAYMLHLILEAHGGTLPSDVHVLFANTGKERPETLDFVHECEMRWGVQVRWIEYANFAPFVEFSGFDEEGPRFTAGPLTHAYREVTYATASRHGEPFEKMIRARSFLPNPVMRICTQELKIRPMKQFAAVELGFDHWTNVIGLRADEPRRVAKTTAQDDQRWDNICPLATAGKTITDVTAFWNVQPFDLDLMSHEGNCDLCFLKGRKKIERIMRARPGLAPWWIDQENVFGAVGDGTFRKDRPSYKRMLQIVQSSPLLPGMGFEEDDDALPCACTD